MGTCGEEVPLCEWEQPCPNAKGLGKPSSGWRSASTLLLGKALCAVNNFHNDLEQPCVTTGYIKSMLKFKKIVVKFYKVSFCSQHTD